MKPPRLVIMGVSGCGKSTVGVRVAERLGVAFLEGDALHSPRNIALMRSGVALTDDDRRDWLDAIARQLKDLSDDQGLVIACSALKRSYRDRLRLACPALQFVHLHGTHETIAQRLAQRRDHYMPSTLLASQFDILEIPQNDEPAWVLNVDATVTQLVEHVTQHLQAHVS